MEFLLNVFAEFSDKNNIILKRGLFVLETSTLPQHHKDTQVFHDK